MTRGVNAFTPSPSNPIEFDRSDVCLHLFVHEFHNASEFPRDHVCDENEFYAAGRKAIVHSLPKLVRVLIITKEISENSRRIIPKFFDRRSKALRDSPRLPVRSRICSIVEHLTDDLASKTGIHCSLKFNENGDAFTRHEKMVERPPASTIFSVGNGLFTPDKQKLTIPIGDDLRVLRYQPLHGVFTLGRCWQHCSEFAV